MMTKEQYTEAIERLNYLTLKYDEGTPEVSDKEWDDLYFACCEYEQATGDIDPKSPSATIQFDVINSLKKVTHNHPMLSLDKTKDINVLIRWLTYESVVMAKMDGLTCSLCYEDGKLVSAETRGNGTVGEDILHNAKVIPSIPKTIPTKERTIIDGEVICKYDDFEEFSDMYKNPRNFASGSIRLMDANECAKRHLTFVAWDEISSNFNFLMKLQHLKEMGFIVVPFAKVDIENLTEQQEKMRQKCADLNYPIDGLVYRINDDKIWKAQGKTDHAFQGSYAFKFYDEMFETSLIDIFWSMGRTGVLTPVARFEPVEIEGTTVQNASLHNISIMKETLGTAYAGQKVKVFKANMIIPQIGEAEHEEGHKALEIPTVCPICGAELKVEKKYATEVLICPNKSCGGKLEGRLLQFIGKHGLDIESMSEKTVKSLISLGWLTKLSDVFTLKDHRVEWISLSGFGEGSVDKILEGIPQSIEMWRVIASAGIPNVEKHIAQLLADYYNNDWYAFRNAVNDKVDFTQLDGIGAITAKTLIDFDYSEIDEVMDYLTIRKLNDNGKLANKSFCVTGKLVSMKRDDLIKLIEENGGKFTSVGKGLDYLICNDKDSGSSKMEKAKKLGITVITEDEFMAML